MPHTEELDVLSVKVPPTIKKDLEKRHARRGEISKVIRGLLKLYLAGKIPPQELASVTDLLN